VTTTPIKRFRKKKKPTMRKKMKKKLQNQLLSSTAIKSISVDVIPFRRTSYQPAVVAITNRVIMAFGMSSKV